MKEIDEPLLAPPPQPQPFPENVHGNHQAPHSASGVAPSSLGDLEEGGSEEIVCRLCLDGGGPDLIAPCQCSGTQQFVHRSCLDTWRSVKEGAAFWRCTTCMKPFHLSYVAPGRGHTWRQWKFTFFLTRDLLLVFLAIQLVVILFGCLAALVDSCSARWALLTWTTWGPRHPRLFYYCFGALLTLAVFGFIGAVARCVGALERRVDSPSDPAAAARPRPHPPGPLDVFCSPWSLGGNAFACTEGTAALCFCAAAAFALLGLLYGILAAFAVWQALWQRHYHILAKRALTEEYAVEDLHGNYTEPHLDPTHVARLQELGLM